MNKIKEEYKICPKCKAENSFSKFRWKSGGWTELCRECGFERLIGKIEKQNNLKGGNQK